MARLRQLASGLCTAQRFGLLCLVLLSTQVAADDFFQAQGAMLSLQSERQAVQARIDELDDETQALLSRYRRAGQQVDELTWANTRLERQIASQSEEIAALEQQLAGIETTRREIYPLMTQMLHWLEQLVEKDMPFLQEEREQRLQILTDLLADPEAGLGEQFGRLLEAYGIELDYGHSLETWRGALPDDANGRVVDFLHVGRIGLYYLALDGESAGYWDGELSAWKPLDKASIVDVRDGLRLARKEMTPSLLSLPLPAAGQRMVPEEAAE